MPSILSNGQLGCVLPLTEKARVYMSLIWTTFGTYGSVTAQASALYARHFVTSYGGTVC